jgi:hypothetical protein
MSTRSLIGLLNADKSVTHIYCHFDGYPDGVGQTLLDHYTDFRKIKELIALGDLSILGSEIGERHSFDGHHNNEVASTWCLAYGRDRNEAEARARIGGRVQGGFHRVVG